MNAHLITVGDELLIGQVVDTNAAWLAERLTEAGVRVTEVHTVADREEAIGDALARSWNGADLVILTGGIGPTEDDRTREAIARFFEAELRIDPEARERIAEYYRDRDRAVPDSVDELARVPAGFEPLPNGSGTAPGLWKEDGGRVLVALPGVPDEMKVFIEEVVLPRLEDRLRARINRQRTILTVGVPESTLVERLDDVGDYTGHGVELAYLPGGGTVRLRISGRTSDPGGEMEERMDRLADYIYRQLGDAVFGEGTDRLEGVVGRMLTDAELTVSLAESCTGGAVIDRLTDVPGASTYVRGGIVAYSNGVKTGLLDVDPAMLDREGAVSAEVARAMARGVRRRLSTDLGFATTGIAGPTGGTPDKPVGTVWIARADEQGAEARRLQLTDRRLLNKERTTVAVLDWARRYVLDSDRVRQ